MTPEKRITDIAAVVQRHQPNKWGQHDGWWECCCSHDATVPWSADHVSAEIVKALGMTQFWQVDLGPGIGWSDYGPYATPELAMEELQEAQDCGYHTATVMTWWSTSPVVSH